MALKGLKTRVISAVIFFVIIVGGIFGGPEAFGALVGVMTILLMLEFFEIVIAKSSENRKKQKLVWIVAAFLPVLWFFMKIYQGQLPNFYEFLPIALGLIYIPFLFELWSKSSAPFANIGALLLGFFYITVPMILLLDIGLSPIYNPYLVFGLLVLIWVNDIGAYFVGSLIGKRPLAPTVSPNKTWEGSIGGWVFTILSAILYFYVFLDKPWAYTLLLGFVVGLFGSLGDLVESKLKRNAGIKDSGSLMPGHGGMLDRFDAFIFSLPFVFLFLKYGVSYLN